MAQARRALYGQTPGRSMSNSSATSNTENPAVLNSLRLDQILNKIDSLATELKNVNKNVSDRIDKLEVDLEKKLSDRLTDKLAQTLDKRVNNEIKRMNKLLDERVDTLWADLNNDLDSINGKVSSLSDAIQTVQPPDANESKRKLSAVFRKLPESVNEKLDEKVNMIIKDHMKVDQVQVTSTQRIPNQNNGSLIPGVVIATFRNEEDRNKVLKAKAGLQKTV